MNNQKGAAGIVLMLILILAGAPVVMKGLSSNPAEQAQEKIAQTTATLAEAKDALIGFAIRNRRLPCPAPGNSKDGIESTPETRNCSSGPIGVLPWATLGVSETDAWGNRFTYRVSEEFARKAPDPDATIPELNAFKDFSCIPTFTPQLSPFASCSTGDIKISTVGDKISAVLLSHGPNGYGAYNTQGKRNPESSSDTGERENYDADKNFSLKTTDNFDDFVVWITSQNMVDTFVKIKYLNKLNGE